MKKMKINKFNLKNLTKYAEQEGLSEINTTMIQVVATMVNEYLKNIEQEGVLIDTINSSGARVKKKNALIDSILPSFNLLGKILKDNNLVLAKKQLDEEGDKFKDMIQNLMVDEDEEESLSVG